MSGASLAPAAAVDHFNPRTDLAPVIIAVAASTALNVIPLRLPPLPEQMTTTAVGVISKSPLTCCLRRSWKCGRKKRTIAWMKERRKTSNLTTKRQAEVRVAALAKTARKMMSTGIQIEFNG